MGRFLLFFAAVIFLTRVLAGIPFVGRLFQIPFLGFWFTAILLSLVIARAGTEALDRRARKSLEKSLGAVDTPHHKGKLGALLLAQGRAKKAVPLFEAAAEGDPESLEWRYRLGLARLRAGGDPRAALDALDSVLAEDDEYAFGEAMLASARAAQAAGFPDNAAERVARFERDQGPSPESVLLRAEVLKGQGRRKEAMSTLDELGALNKGPRGRGGVSRWSAWFRALRMRLLP